MMMNRQQQRELRSSNMARLNYALRVQLTVAQQRHLAIHVKLTINELSEMISCCSLVVPTCRRIHGISFSGQQFSDLRFVLPHVPHEIMFLVPQCLLSAVIESTSCTTACFVWHLAEHTVWKAGRRSSEHVKKTFGCNLIKVCMLAVGVRDIWREVTL